MKTRKFLIFLLLAASILLLTGCSVFNSSVGGHAQFVKETVKAINDHKNVSGSLDTGGSILYDLESDPVYEPYFMIKKLKVSVDEKDSSIVHYSCKIPGLVGAAFNMVYQRCFLLNDAYSKPVEVEGDLKIITDENGNRKIDISHNDNVFAVYASMRHVNPLLFRDLPDDSEAGLLNAFLNMGTVFYANLTDMSAEEYSETVVAPELENYTANLSYIARASNTNRKGYSWGDRFSGLPIEGKAGIVGIGLLFGLPVIYLIFRSIYDLIMKIRDNYKAGRGELRKLWRKEKKVLDKNQSSRLTAKKYKARLEKELFADKDHPGDRGILSHLPDDIFLPNTKKYQYLLKDKPDSSERVSAVKGLNYPIDRAFLLFLIENDDDKEVRKAAISKLSYPEEKETFIRCVKNQEIAGEALKKLPYAENKKIILHAAMKDDASTADAVEQIPYPEEREILTNIAVSTRLTNIEKLITEKFQYPDDREFMVEYLKQRGNHHWDYQDELLYNVLRQIPYPDAREELIDLLKNAKSDKIQRSIAVNKLPYPKEADALTAYFVETEDSYYSSLVDTLSHFSYPEDRENLIRIAKNANCPWIREYIVKNKLPYPEEAETLSYILENDPSESVIQAASAKIAEDESEKQKRFAELAVKGKEPAVRMEALKNLPYPEYKKIYLQAAQKDSAAENRRYAIEKLEFPADRKPLAKIAQNDDDQENRKIAREKLPFLEEPSAYAHEDLLSDKAPVDDRIRGAIALFMVPHSSEMILRRLCDLIQEGMRSERGSVTASGWAAAALGKVLTAEMTPDDIEPNRKCFEKAIDQYNEVVKEIQAVQLKLGHLVGRSMNSLSKEEEKNYQKFKELQAELDRGLGNYMLDNGDLPFAYLPQILRDNQNRVPRFVKQGIIMGLLDWLTANPEHPEAKELLETVVAVRADLIRSDNNLSFFEVRVPEDCTKEEYAELLAFVLHSANPSIKFCSTKKLLDLAETEVPGCIDMLRNYPLRLIDPVNKKTQGFYKFDPYIHEMWIQYQPPKDTGKVISRYHEVDDRTLPLSSGLNLQLFRDIYSVIPTLFHEYQHFNGDPNEASVFLKTQVFSISFYRRHKTAKASRDVVFASLSELLGQPPAADKCSELNSLIEQYYGKETTPAEAMAHADQELTRLNNVIYTINQTEKWDPSVKFPLLIENEDKENRDLIRNIIIRWDKTPRSITEKEFREITEK